jgi:hypothetical protein
MVTVEVLIPDGSKAILKHEFGGWVCSRNGKVQKVSKISTGNAIVRGTVLFVGLVELHVREILEVIP